MGPLFLLKRIKQIVFNLLKNLTHQSKSIFMQDQDDKNNSKYKLERQDKNL